MTNFEFGLIVLVRFPFTDQLGVKQRPAVVVSSRAYNQVKPDVILMAVTSQIRLKAKLGEALIIDWKEAGLLKPSAIKPVIFTAEKTIVKRQLGMLGTKDQQSLKAVMALVLG